MTDPAERITGLVGALRAHGVRIGTGETVDAARAAEALGLGDRELLREGLAATLLHGPAQRAVFDPVFDLYFPRGVGAPDAGPSDRESLRDRLAEVLAADDRALMAQLAASAVDGLGGYGSSPGSDGWSAYQTLERLRPGTLLARVRADVRAGAGVGGDFADRLLDDEIRRRIEEFRRLVGAEARRRVAERRGRDEIARRGVRPTADRVDFLFASRDQLAELRRAVQPLARKLATRLAARRRRAARGTVDLRRTLRSSLSTGGVPMRPVLRRRRPVRPELVLLCDVSGSVSGFSDFTMLLVQALHDQFSKVRVFAFVNRLDEVTGLLDRGRADPEGLGARIREGIAFTLRDPRLRTVVILDPAVNFCYAGPFTVGFATLAEQVLRGGSATLGVLNGSLAGGAMLGTLAGGAMGGRPRVGLLVAALAGWLGAGMAVLGLVHSTPAVVATVLAMGFAIGFQGVFGLSWIQRNIPQEVLSRVISVDMVLGYAAAPLSLIVCGALARTSTLALFGVVAAVLALTGLAVLGSRAVREMR